MATDVVSERSETRASSAPEARVASGSDSPRRDDDAHPEAGRIEVAEIPPEPARTAGTLLAVCGLCGGAGASTLAYLVALAARRTSGEAVLVCDAGDATAGLASYAGVESPRSLIGAANAIAAHEALADGLFAIDRSELRVMASAPQLGVEADADGLERLLRDARDAHALTVADCGTVRSSTERQIARAASHVAWVLPATVSGVRRTARVLELFDLDASSREVVVARHDAAGRRPPTEDLARLAASRNAPLVLMPHVPDLAERDPEAALAAAELTLDAIQAVLRR